MKCPHCGHGGDGQPEKDPAEVKAKIAIANIAKKLKGDKKEKKDA